MVGLCGLIVSNDGLSIPYFFHTLLSFTGVDDDISPHRRGGALPLPPSPSPATNRNCQRTLWRERHIFQQALWAPFPPPGDSRRSRTARASMEVSAPPMARSCRQQKIWHRRRGFLWEEKAVQRRREGAAFGDREGKGDGGGNRVWSVHGKTVRRSFIQRLITVVHHAPPTEVVHSN